MVGFSVLISSDEGNCGEFTVKSERTLCNKMTEIKRLVTKAL